MGDPGGRFEQALLELKSVSFFVCWRLSDLVVGGEYRSHANKGISAHWLSSVLILEKSVVVTHPFFRLSDAKN